VDERMVQSRFRLRFDKHFGSCQDTTPERMS
jgi:hypothetical protein